jgi:protein TonB
MFDLITGEAKHIPSKPALPILVSSMAQAVLVAIVIVPVLFFTGTLPEVPTMMAFVAAPPSPPPPPPPPPPPAAVKASRPAETQPVPPSGVAAPVEAPTSIEPERAAAIDEGVPGGVEGGVPGGVLGGVVGGLPADIPPPPPPPPAPARRDPVRVGGQIKEPQLVRRIEPVYHPLAVRANVQGTVILEAIVDKEGRVAEVRVLRSAHRLLDEAAVEAVREWRYVPLVLNGIPERFVLTVVLTFNLTQQAAG